MVDLHQAIVEGLAEELRPPPDYIITIHYQREWAIHIRPRALNGIHWPQTSIYLYPDCIRVYDAALLPHTFDYHLPDLVERLQTVIDLE